MGNVTYSKLAGPTASAADTETRIGGADITLLPGGPWTIKKIRVCFYQGVIDKATTGKLELKIDTIKGPFEFAIGGSIGITTTSGATGPNIATEEIDVNIPGIPGNSGVGVYTTFAEAVEEVTVSITYV